MARQHSMDRDVALKILHKDISQRRTAVDRFFLEARVAGKLRHTNTITMFDVGQDTDGTLFMVMELLRGRPLSGIIELGGPMAVERTVRIAIQVCMSLAEAHEVGMVHRDLKPENIFLTKEAGRKDFVKLLDFGIVKLLEDPELLHLTTTGSTPGTPFYMSPEAGRSKPVSPRSDLYSLGIILFEMLTGERPFDAPNPVQVVIQHLQSPVPDMSTYGRRGDIPDALEKVIRKLLSKDPKDRYANAYDVVEALLHAVPVGSSKVFRPTPTDPNVANLATAESMPAIESDTQLDGPKRHNRTETLESAGED